MVPCSRSVKPTGRRPECQRKGSTASTPRSISVANSSAGLAQTKSPDSSTLYAKHGIRFHGNDRRIASLEPEFVGNEILNRGRSARDNPGFVNHVGEGKFFAFCQGMIAADENCQGVLKKDLFDQMFVGAHPTP